MDCSRGCRIAVGWNSNVFNATVISKSDQMMHFMVADVHSRKTFYISFVYAENDPKEIE